MNREVFQRILDGGGRDFRNDEVGHKNNGATKGPLLKKLNSPG